MKFCDRHPLSLDNAAVLLRFVNLTTKHTNREVRNFDDEVKYFVCSITTA